ncbi:hypothetical protein ACFLZT_00875 [Thermodesulfobacteriota bacterium]
MQFIETILIIVLGILVYSLRTYFSKKTENIASLEDIKKITSEQQTGKFIADAKKAVMAAISRADTNMQNLSHNIAIDGIDKKSDYNPTQHRKKMFEIWTNLIEILDEHVVLLDQNIKDEVTFLRDAWPHIMGGSDTIKWIGDTIVTVFMKRASIGVFRKRMETSMGSKVPFDSDNAKENYAIKNLEKESQNMLEELALTMLGYGIKNENIKKMFPFFSLKTMRSDNEIVEPKMAE